MEFSDYTRFEKEKHDTFFLPYYKQRGWKVIQDNIGFYAHWDVLLDMDGVESKIDEKARQGEYKDFLVEVMQDLRTGNKGWLYGEKDYYFYASWAKSEQPSSFYAVKSDGLKSLIANEWEKLPKKISRKGWGVTLFVTIPWQDLELLDIAKRLK